MSLGNYTKLCWTKNDYIYFSMRELKYIYNSKENFSTRPIKRIGFSFIIITKKWNGNVPTFSSAKTSQFGEQMFSKTSRNLNNYLWLKNFSIWHSNSTKSCAKTYVAK